MILLKDTPYQNTAEFLSAAIRTAEYYGFGALEDMPRIYGPKNKGAIADAEIQFARKDEKTLLSAAKKLLTVAGNPHHAVLAWRIVPATATQPFATLELHVSGTNSTIAEALLLVVGNAIAHEAGVEKRVLSINNIGTSDSSGRFVRDVGTYLRKHIETISPTLRPKAAEDPLGTLIQLIERGHPAVPRAPQPMEYLTEEERRRFWEILEYLESFGLSYELNGQILGSRDCWSHALFEILAVDAESNAREPIAIGGRYDPVLSRLAKTPRHGAMISIMVESRGKTEPKRESRGVPSIYFAHLGPEARRRSLFVLESLRRHEIPVYQGLWHERIGEQMATAEQLATPYIIIMGHKEAMEGTVLVREVATNSQDAILLDELPNYLKRHRFGVPQNKTATL